MAETKDINFPFFGDGVAVTASTDLPLYKELEWDFIRNTPRARNGNFTIVTGNEAIKTWCYKALITRRYREIIYTWNYGGEFETLIGSKYTPSLTKAECIRYIEECLLINPYIKGISDVKIDFKEGSLKVACKIDTVYGSTGIEVRI